LAAKELQVGDKAPDFNLPSSEGRAISLKEFKEKRDVVLYFYPKDDTPGCSKEACGFRDERPRIIRKGAAVLGVSLDGVDSHRRFIAKYGLNFPLLVDEGAALSKSYGVYKRKALYGRKYWGLERTTFIIGKDGRIREIFRKVKVDGHTREVLDALGKP
jgi:thioredoxin-dependent peroxiredoxin